MFGRIVASVFFFKAVSTGSTYSLYKPPQDHLISHHTSLLLSTRPTSLIHPSVHLGTHPTMSAAKCLLSLMVVLVAAVCVVQTQERIKICGRELIRLVVSSCGNSRLRRSIPDVEVGQHRFTSHCKYFMLHLLTSGAFG